MDIWHGLSSVPADLDGSVVTIGVFDGVHRGHRRLIETAVKSARDNNVACILMTFNPHPLTVFAPERTPKLLGDMSDRIEIAAQLGVDHMLVIDFNHELAQVPADKYIEQVLSEKLRAKVVVVGCNFTFGKDAAGTSDTLEKLCPTFSIEPVIIPLLEEEGHTVSSSFIRQELDQGHVDQAAEALGRLYSVRSEIERGAGRGGKELGFPTANLYVDNSRALPADGVYAGWLTIDETDGETEPIAGDMEPGVRYPAAISVGLNPTFGDDRRSVEAFVLDRDADLYHRVATVEFAAYIRGMVKFNGIEELLDAINNDVSMTRKLLDL